MKNKNPYHFEEEDQRMKRELVYGIFRYLGPFLFCGLLVFLLLLLVAKS